MVRIYHFLLTNCTYIYYQTTTTTRRFLANKEAAVASSIANKYFQLEELEDKDTCTTEVLLNDDSTISVSVTDGPIFKAASGTWTMMDENEFEMTLSRTYQAGKEKSDMGDFEYTVERTFLGQITHIGACVAMTGSIHSMDSILGDENVGFFTMIDTTDARLMKDDDEYENKE
jgi:hypothetical protein